MNSVTQEQQTEGNEDIARNNISDTNNSNANKNKMMDSLKLSAYTVENGKTQTTPQTNVTLEPTQQTGHFPERANRQEKSDLKRRTNRRIYPRVSRLLPNFWIESVTSSFWTACDRLETINLITLSPITEAVRLEPPDKSMDNFKINITNSFATTVTTQMAHTLESRNGNDVK